MFHYTSLGTGETVLSRTTQLLLISPLVGVLVPILYLALLSCISKRPSNLGVTDGLLAECPKSPNCVSSQTTDAEHRMEPISFIGSPVDAFKRLLTIIEAYPRTQIVTSDEHYLHAEFTTLLFRYVDDGEFLLDADAHVIHFRSASRTGHSDLGLNRKRIDEIRLLFNGR